jgi:anti-sigma B factor antagonist
MENFLSRNENGIIVETVNLIKATSEEAEEFKIILLEHIRNGNVNLLIDLQRCNFIDSTFLSALIVAQKVAMEDGGSLKLLSPKNEVAEVLEATGMTKIFDIFSSIEEALPSFNSDGQKSAVG